MSKKHLLVGASAIIAAAAGLAGAASAQVTTQIYNGGNSLFASYLRQAEDCYGNPTALIIQGPNLVSPTSLNIPAFNWTVGAMCVVAQFCGTAPV